MTYTFHNRDIVLEFTGNLGSATVLAASETEAMCRVREVFCHVRDESVRPRLAGEYLVQFKVALNYRLSMLRAVERIARRIRTPHAFEHARYLDRYIIASLALASGKPDFLQSPLLADDLDTLRKAAVVAREVAGILQFVDWDIAIANYRELNSKTGHKSRVVRARVPHANNTHTRTVARREASSNRRTKRTARKD